MAAWRRTKSMAGYTRPHDQTLLYIFIMFPYVLHFSSCVNRFYIFSIFLFNIFNISLNFRCFFVLSYIFRCISICFHMFVYISICYLYISIFSIDTKTIYHTIIFLYLAILYLAEATITMPSPRNHILDFCYLAAAVSGNG